MINFLQITSRVLAVPEHDILRKVKTERAVRARHICAFVMREFDRTEEEIGGVLLRRRSTARHSIRVARKLQSSSAAFAVEIEAVRTGARLAMDEHFRREFLAIAKQHETS